MHALCLAFTLPMGVALAQPRCDTQAYTADTLHCIHTCAKHMVRSLCDDDACYTPINMLHWGCAQCTPSTMLYSGPSHSDSHCTIVYKPLDGDNLLLLRGVLGGGSFGSGAGYSTVFGGFCRDGYTFAHEVGHNQGEPDSHTIWEAPTRQQ